MGNSHANDVQCWLPGVRDRENRRSGTVKRCRGCSRAQKAHQLRIYPWLPRGVPAPSITAFVFFFRGDRSKSRNFARFGRDLGHNGAAKFFAIWARFGYKHAKIRNEIWVVRARKTASPQLVVGSLSLTVQKLLCRNSRRSTSLESRGDVVVPRS